MPCKDRVRNERDILKPRKRYMGKAVGKKDFRQLFVTEVTGFASGTPPRISLQAWTEAGGR